MTTRSVTIGTFKKHLREHEIMVELTQDIKIEAWVTQIGEWCETNNIRYRCQGYLTHTDEMGTFKVSTWRIPDKDQRLMFALRWV